VSFTVAAVLCVVTLPSDGPWRQQDHLLADVGDIVDRFGFEVAISGDTIVAGAFLDDTAAGRDAGSAYVFTRSEAVWSQQDHLHADDAAVDDWFGIGLGICGDTIVVGARYEDTAGDNAGSA
jgi:hypothetical protein